MLSLNVHRERACRWARHQIEEEDEAGGHRVVDGRSRPETEEHRTLGQVG
jgi:hypothetical protein